MRKVIKILGKVLSWIILTFVSIPLLVALLINIPAVQNFVVRKATEFISKKLETTASIESIRIRAFSKLTATGVYIQDYEGDTMIYANTLSANISKTALLNKKFIIGDVSLDKAKIYLYTPKGGEMNLAQVLARLNNNQDTTTSKTKLIFRNIKITDSRFKLQNQGADTLTYGVNYSNMVFSDLNISSRQLEIDGGAISMDIKKMSFRDISGVIVEKMTAANLLIDDGVIALDKARLILPDSDIRLDNFRMGGNSWESMSNVLDSVRFNVTISRSNTSMRTISYFVPTLGRHSDLKMKDIDIDFNGYINNFRTSLNFMSDDETTYLNTDVALAKVMDLPKASFDVDIKELKSSGNNLKHIINGLITDSLSGSTADILNRGGNLRLTAKAKGSMRRFNANADLDADIGRIAISGTGGNAKGGNTYFDARTSVNSFAAGKLLDNALLGNVTVNADASGFFGKKDIEIKGSVNIQSAQFNGYTYTDVAASGSYAGKKVDATVVSGDPKLQFNVIGSADFSQEVPAYDVNLDMKHADLYKLNVNKKDTLSVISGRLVAKGSGSNLNNINGRAVISDLVYHSSTDDVKADSLILTGRNSEGSHFLAFNSPYADVVFNSDIGYDEIIDYLQHILYDYLPALDNDTAATNLHHHPKDAEVTPLIHSSAKFTGAQGYPGISFGNQSTQSDSTETLQHHRIMPLTQVHNNSELTINIKKANNIAAIFLPGFNIAEGTKANFTFNPVKETFSMQAKSDYIEYAKFFVTKLDLDVDNITEPDAVSLKFVTEDLYLPAFSVPSNNITAIIRNNHIDVKANLSNNTTDLNAFLDVESVISRNTSDKKLNIGVLFAPSSYITTGPKRWGISSDSIHYSPSHLSVDNFRINSDQQSLVLDGVISDKKTDTLKLSLDRFSIRPVNALLGFDKIVVDGNLDGYAELVSGMKDPVMIADVGIDSLSTGGYVSAPLRLKSNWDFSAERALVSLQNVTTGKNIIKGFYRPDNGSYFAEVDIDRIPATAATIFLPPDLVKDTEGMAAILLQVRNGKGIPKMDGTVSISDFATTVDITNVKYSAATIDIEIDNNIAVISKTILQDPDGNTATLSAKADLRNSSNIKYDAQLLPKNLMVLNTDAKDNDQFYGKIYISGAANLQGSRSGVNIDVAATTQNNSALYLPLSSKSSISEVDWLTFETTKQDETPEGILESKKLSYQKAMKAEKEGGPATSVNLNISLNVTPGLLVSILIPSINSELSARGSASLDILMNPGTGEMNVFGTYEVTDGDFYFSLPPFISNKRFVLQPGGTIQLSGDFMDAKLNVEALYRLRASLQPIASSLVGLNVSASTRVPVECIIHITENLTNPNLAFDVKIPSADADIQGALNSVLSTSENTALNFITLIALGSFAPDNNAESNTGNAKNNASSLGLDFLTNQLANMISNEKFNVMLRYRTDDAASDELDFGFSYNLLGNDRLILELEGNYDLGNNPSTSNSQNLSNMSGDASITWLLTPSGNLRLKGFTRTINRYDENQGLQENGVGIYYKEDFNSFRDIAPQWKMRRILRLENRAAKAEERKIKEEKRQAATRATEGQQANVGTSPSTNPLKDDNTNKSQQNSIEKRRALIEEQRRKWNEEREKRQAQESQESQTDKPTIDESSANK